MTNDEAAQYFPKYVTGVIDLGTLAASQCHGPDLPKMLQEAEAMLNTVYAETRSNSNNLEQTVGVETFLRTAIPIFLKQSYDPDREIMLFRCRQAKEAMPELAEKVARNNMASDSK